MRRSAPGLGGVSSRMASTSIPLPLPCTDDKNENCILSPRTIRSILMIWTNQYNRACGKDKQQDNILL